ncbi:MAG: hypothetical protein H6833_12720 [Planctomycetes bacterium]|nr:hypothetical protein [Planctomycetota bacterium]
MLQRAEAIAAELGHSAFGTDHVLIATFELEGARVETLLPPGRKIDDALAALRVVLGEPVPIRAPRVRGPSPLLRRNLENAYRTLAAAQSPLEPAAFLRALLSQRGLPAVQALRALGIPNAESG